MKRQDESGETWDGKGWDQNISSLGSIGVSGREYVDETAAQGDQVWHCSDSGEGGGEFDKDDEEMLTDWTCVLTLSLMSRRLMISSVSGPLRLSSSFGRMDSSGSLLGRSAKSGKSRIFQF